MSAKINLSKADIHPHLRARMVQRGVTKEEIEKTLEKGEDARDAKLGTYGKANFTSRKRLLYIIRSQERKR